MMDAGVEVDLFICNALYVPQCPMNLLSPQHLAQKCSEMSMVSQSWPLSAFCDLADIRGQFSWTGLPIYLLCTLLA
jgi:hypothetical protein